MEEEVVVVEEDAVGMIIKDKVNQNYLQMKSEEKNNKIKDLQFLRSNQHHRQDLVGVSWKKHLFKKCLLLKEKFWQNYQKFKEILLPGDLVLLENNYDLENQLLLEHKHHLDPLKLKEIKDNHQEMKESQYSKTWNKSKILSNRIHRFKKKRKNSCQNLPLKTLRSKYYSKMSHRRMKLEINNLYKKLIQIEFRRSNKILWQEIVNKTDKNYREEAQVNSNQGYNQQEEEEFEVVEELAKEK